MLAVGTVHVQTLLVVGTAAIGAGLWALWLYRRKSGRWPISLPAVGVFALTAWTAFQAVPLPAWLIAKLAPRNADTWAHALDALGDAGPSWHSISLDPGATWVEVLKGVTYLGVLIASTAIAHRRGAVFGVATVFLSALAAGVLTVAHGLAGMTKVFGIYEPIYFSGAWNMGPLLNSNHLGGYMNLGAMCGIGLLLRRETAIPRGVIGVGVATLFALTLTSGSRGAVVVLPVGVALVVGFLRHESFRLDRRSVSRGWLNILAFTALAGGLALAGLGITTPQWKSLVDQDLSKLSIVEWAKPLVLDHAWLGIGRGSFETVYPGYRPTAGHFLWTHPENLLVQWTAEWGVPVTLLAAMFFAWLLRPSRIGATRSAVAAGAVAGILILVIQNWVDFSLEIPSVPIAVMVLLGSCWADTGRRGVAKWDGGGDHPKQGVVSQRASKQQAAAMIAAVALAGFAVVGLAWAKGIPTPLADRLAFQTMVDGPPIPKRLFVPLIRSAMLRHPAESYLPLAGAERAWRVRDDNPLPYLQRVFTLAKTYGRAHLLLAEILLWRGADVQGLMELKFACRDEPQLVAAAADLALRNTQDYEDLMRIVPDGRVGAHFLDTLGARLHTRAHEVGRRIDQEALRRDPSLVAPRIRRATDLIATLRSAGEGCTTEDERRACADAVEEEVRSIEQASPDSSRAAQLRADAFMALNRPEDAAKVLALACDRVRDRLPCLKARVVVIAALKRESEVEVLLGEIASAGCSTTRDCAQTWSWIGSFAAGRKNLGTAVNAYRKATTYDPENGELWTRLGDASEALGLHAQAAQAYERALRLRESEPLRKKRDTARAKALDSLPR